MGKAWIAGTLALGGTIAWLAGEPAPRILPCGEDAGCPAGGTCVDGRCVVPLLLFATAPAARCGDGICDLAAGECEGICGADCPDVPCRLPCRLDGICQQEEGAGCPDCQPAGCNFDGLCTVGESPRCPDCTCGDGYCDSAAGECIDGCPGDCPITPCAARCDFDARCEPSESAACPDCSCGDGVCVPEIEDCAICPLDCGACPSGCGDGICGPEDPPDCSDCRPDEGG